MSNEPDEILGICKSRRDWLSKLVLSITCSISAWMIFKQKTFAKELKFVYDSNKIPETTVYLPLQECGGSFCTVYAIDGNIFRGVVDTGSPFLTIPMSCTTRWGCYPNEEEMMDSHLEDTTEIYASQEGNVKWREGILQIGELRDLETGQLYSYGKEGIIFGVLSSPLVRYPGGVFIGLIKYKEDDIRPTFLGQTNFCSIKFNFLQKIMQLSVNPMIPATKDAIQLFDLRPFGDPVYHYTSIASNVKVNGRPIKSAEEAKPIYAIFDTGTTGLLLSRELYDSETEYAKQFREPFFGNVEVDFGTERGHKVTLQADSPLTTPIDIPWNGFSEKGNLVVIGLAFLKTQMVTIDIESERICFE